MYAFIFAPTVNVVNPFVKAVFVALWIEKLVSLLELSAHAKLTVGRFELRIDGVATRPEGAGGITRLTALEAADAAPVPIILVAFTVNV